MTYSNIINLEKLLKKKNNLLPEIFHGTFLPLLPTFSVDLKSEPGLNTSTN